MKKTYIQPSVKAIEIQMNQGLLTGSEKLFSTPQDGGSALSRDSSFDWDDED